MKADKEYDVHLGENVKYLMRAFQITQTQLADKLGMPDSHVCNLLQKANIEDAMLQKIATAIGHEVSVDMIKNYDHEDTIRYIYNTYNNTIENGGTNSGNFQEIFEKGSSQNNYVAEQAFIYAEKITKLEVEIMRLRMKYEPENVEAEQKNTHNS